MIDRFLGFRPVQQESYYFQLIPISLSIINPKSQLPAPDTTYRFTVLKGQQKFDESKIPIPASFTIANKVPVLIITTCRLNFYTPSLNHQRKTQFTLKLVQREQNQDYEVGDYSMDVNQLVSDFKQKNVNRHELKVNFSEDYELQFQIYVETSRINLQKAVKEKKTDRASKSPLRTRKQGETENSAKKNLVKQSKVEQTPSRDIEIQITTQNEDNVSKTIPIEPIQELRQKVQATHQQENPRAPSTKGRSDFQEKVEGSVKSKGSVPLVQTKFKPISKINTPAEIKSTQSQRLGHKEAEVASPIKSHGQQSTQQKIFLWAFLGVGLLLIYWAMHPNSKV